MSLNRSLRQVMSHQHWFDLYTLPYFAGAGRVVPLGVGAAVFQHIVIPTWDDNHTSHNCSTGILQQGG